MNEKTVKRLLDLFNAEYDKLYKANSYGTSQDLNQFDKLLEMFPAIVREFNAARFDILSSDRECAAFARAYKRLMREALKA